MTTIRRSAGFSTFFTTASWRCSIAPGRRRSRRSTATGRTRSFTGYIGAFLGLAPATFRDRDTLPDLAKFFHVGALIRQVRNTEGLAHILQHFFRVPVGIEEFVGHWMPLASRERTYLARRRRASAQAPCSAAACGTASTSSGFTSAR